ncbi:hypothetical protein [Marispirochaeta aestuarii]|uniref:hypothetical protein n=1 Tax=Marispirochaeta aestuarii TaxID=1963862 RepID=UPI002ABD3197|nr:hypothetical protein [Marispirochaeta aestuarii]
MELRQLSVEETKDLEIVYPNGEPTGMVITLRSIDSPECKRVIKKWDKVATRAGRKGLSFEQKEQAAIELLSAATVGWTGYTDGGDEVQCDEEQKVLLYSDQRTGFVREQVDEYLGDKSSFLSRTVKA